MGIERWREAMIADRLRPFAKTVMHVESQREEEHQEQETRHKCASDNRLPASDETDSGRFVSEQVDKAANRNQQR